MISLSPNSTRQELSISYQCLLGSIHALTSSNTSNSKKFISFKHVIISYSYIWVFLMPIPILGSFFFLSMYTSYRLIILANAISYLITMPFGQFMLIDLFVNHTCLHNSFSLSNRIARPTIQMDDSPELSYVSFI